MPAPPGAERDVDSPLIFTATYNEADNIRALVDQCLAVVPSADMLVVDDNSPDGTGVLLDQLALEHRGRLVVLHRPRKLGLGTAHKLAIQYARDRHYDALVTMDADFSHHPRYIPAMLSRLRTRDFVIGSRYAPGGRCDYGFARMAISRSANVCARLLLGLPLRETTTSFRAFSRRTLERLPLDAIRSDGYSFFFESLYVTSKVVTSLAELPIHFEDRRAGQSKISKREVRNGVLNLGRLFLRRMRGVSISPGTSVVRSEALFAGEEGAAAEPHRDRRRLGT